MFPIFFLLLLLPTTAYSVQFQITQFDANTPDILYCGDAKPSQRHVYMNVNFLFRVGWTIYAKKVPIWDLDTGKLTDFSTHFSFNIDTMNNSTYGDGLAFFLAPVGFGIPPNSAGGYLGLFNDTTKDLAPYQIVFVEFDSKSNSWDPNVTHVGINSNSIDSANSTPWNASFHSGDIADVWIIYNATTKNLSVSWTYQRTSNSLEDTSLSYQIDLMKVLPESVQIGFSAATGLYWEQHILRSWEFNSSLDIKETSGKKVRKISLMVILTVVVVGVIVIASAMLWICKGKKKETTEIVNLTSINDALERGAGPRRSVDLMGPNSNMGLVEWIWNLYGKGDLLLAVDGKLQTNFYEKQVECLMIIGLWCAHPDRNLRPSIRQAIQVLKFEAKIPVLPMQMPIPMYHVPIQPLVSSGEPFLTTSLQQGR
ncbi:L-type lectin-domain containing receptor kinase IX.1-like [Fagus crenata]